ncbi:MAG: hypothetical protein RIQ56_469 [Candidatus Parcubacteria bacterium]|jgi:hypothetical protein
MIELRFGSDRRGPTSATQVVFQTEKITFDLIELQHLATALNGQVRGRGGVERAILRDHCAAEVRAGGLLVYERRPGGTPNPYIICSSGWQKKYPSTLLLLERVADYLFDVELCADRDDRLFVH